jgi:hypothetical protein
MNDPRASEIGIKALVAEAGGETALRRGTPPARPRDHAVDGWPVPAAPAIDLEIVRFRDLCNLQDRDFVDAAYRAILHRAPDPNGEDHYLGLLRNGMSKSEILFDLRKSAEGETIGAKIDGLTQPDDAPHAKPEEIRAVKLSDFSELHDAQFVNAAYRGVLNRGPDPIGEDYYLKLLRNGASKAEVLGRLRYSTEGRAIGAPIDGLARAYWVDKLARWPVLGRILGVFAAMWTLPDSERYLRAIANDLARFGEKVDRQHKLVEQNFRDALSDVATRAANELAARSSREELALIQRVIAELNELMSVSEGSRVSIANMERLHRELMIDKVSRQELNELAKHLSTVAEARAMQEQFDRITARFHELDIGFAGLRQSKADASRIEAMKVEVRTTIHRGIDDSNRTFRMLLESKADQSALVSAQRDLEAGIESSIARVMQAVHAIDGKKLDAGSFESIRDETRGTLERAISGLQAAFDSRMTGLTQTVQAIEARKLGPEVLDLVREEIRIALRDTPNGLEAEFNSRLEGVMQELRVLDAKKLDASSGIEIRDQHQGALRAGLEGLTSSIAALAARKVDRGIVEALLAENKETIVRELKQRLRSSSFPPPDLQSPKRRLKQGK